MYRSKKPIDQLVKDLEFEGEKVDRDTFQFVSENGNQFTNLYVDRLDKELIFSAVFYHADRMIEGNIYLFARILEEFYKEDEVRDIIEDVSLQTKYLFIKPSLDEPEFGFEKDLSTDETTHFTLKISYEDKSYEELRKIFEETLENSFKVIANKQQNIGLSIEKVINLYMTRSEIERKLLEIRKLIFKSQFFASMTGRFAQEQKHKAATFKKEAEELFEQFKKENPEVNVESMEKLFELIKS